MAVILMYTIMRETFNILKCIGLIQTIVLINNQIEL